MFISISTQSSRYLYQFVSIAVSIFSINARLNTCRKWNLKDQYISHVNFVPTVDVLVKYTDNHTKHTFNPKREFIFRSKSANDACVTNIITAVVSTTLSLFLLLLMIILSNNGNDAISPKNTLRKLKNGNPNKISIDHLNINSIRHTLELLKELIGINLDIFLISETKLNDTFPPGQYLIDGYQVPFRFDRNDNGGGLLLYFRDHIPWKKLKLEFNSGIEAIAIEINLKKRNPHKDMFKNHLHSIGIALNDLCLKYENFVLIGDFNSVIHEDAMSVLCAIYN